jgi:tetratricopeptide (TPR) repeat protein
VPAPSALDADLFYQLMLGELEQRQGEAPAAVQRLVEAARKTRDDRLFRRAVDMAIEARSADLALGALKDWRKALPRSIPAAEMQAQVLMALGKPSEAQEPVKALIEATPAAQRPAALAALPRLVVRGNQARASAQALDEVLKPWRDTTSVPSATRLAAQLATARSWLIAGDGARALELARAAQQAHPEAVEAALLALDLMGQEPRAEELVQAYLKTAKPEPQLRLAYARRLTASQRYADALASARAATASDPQLAAGWLMQGALQLELGQPREAQAAIERYLAVRPPLPPAATAAVKPASPANPAAAAGQEAADEDDGDDDEAQHGPRAQAAQELSQAYLMLAQASEQLKDYGAALAWLDKAADAQPGASASVLLRRASLLVRQGKLDEARALVQTLPEGNAEELRAKMMGEAQLLRDAQRWQAAYDLLKAANDRLPGDADLLYEQALVAEKLRRFDEMELLLRRVIEIKPDQQHAYNALGYSLADRGLRLSEARELIAKALTLAPGDPFITDSMGWVEFRSGNRAAALKLLREAYERRPDVEIAAHLGEVLWADGQRDAARQIWRAGRLRDAGNEVLTETLTRLKVQL